MSPPVRIRIRQGSLTYLGTFDLRFLPVSRNPGPSLLHICNVCIYAAPVMRPYTLRLVHSPFIPRTSARRLARQLRFVVVVSAPKTAVPSSITPRTSAVLSGIQNEGNDDDGRGKSRCMRRNVDQAHLHHWRGAETGPDVAWIVIGRRSRHEH